MDLVLYCVPGPQFWTSWKKVKAI